MRKSFPEHLTLKRVHLDRGMIWPHESEEILFLFASAGRGEYSWEGGTVPLSPGTILRATTGKQGRVCATAETGFTMVLFSASRSHLIALLEVGELSTLPRLDSHLQQPKVLAPTAFQAKRYHRELRGVTGRANLKERGRLLKIATDLLSDEFAELPANSTGTGQYGNSLVLKLARLSAAELVNLRAEELAKRLGCSRRHLSRLLRTRFNVSFSGLKMEVRLLRALDFLKDPEAKVITVALECGFNHLGFFNTCFRRRFGTSPSGWRKLSSRQRGVSETSKPGLPWSVPGLVDHGEEAGLRV